MVFFKNSFDPSGSFSKHTPTTPSPSLRGFGIVTSFVREELSFVLRFDFKVEVRQKNLLSLLPIVFFTGQPNEIKMVVCWQTEVFTRMTDKGGFLVLIFQFVMIVFKFRFFCPVVNKTNTN